MSRKTRGRHIDTVVYQKAGLEVKIYLSTTDMKFSAELNGERFTGKDGEEIRHKILTALIRGGLDLQWTPVIIVEEEGPWMNDREVAYVGFKKEKVWFAQRPDGKWLRCDDSHTDATMGKPDVINARVIGKCEYESLPSVVAEGRYLRGEEKYYLPFSEELWEGLESVEDGLRKLREKLQHLLGDPRVFKLLESAGQKIRSLMLMEAKPE